MHSAHEGLLSHNAERRPTHGEPSPRTGYYFLGLSMTDNQPIMKLGLSAGHRWPLPLLLNDNPLLNNRVIALISDRSAEEIDVADAGSGGGYVYETSKARLTFFNESSPHLVADVLARWPASKRVVELEVAKCPDRDLLARLFGQRYDVSTMQILSFNSSREVHTAAISAKVGVPSPEVIELVEGFHRETLRSSITIDRARALINGSSRDFFESQVNGRYVAVAALTRRVNSARCFSFLYVDPRHREQGFGEAIFSHALTEGLKSNREIFLHVDSSNVPAVRLYSKFAPADIGAYLTFKVSPPNGPK